MGIAFGLFLIVVLIVALLNRRRQNKAWVQEERYDESGAWMDKRAGERGTYGSLDVEMEAERRDVKRQGQVNELARLIRDYAIEHYPGFHALSDDQIRGYTSFAKTQVAPFVAMAEQMLTGYKPNAGAQPPSEMPHAQAVKKLMLDFSYRHYPALLDLEIEAIRNFDRYAGGISNVLIEKIGEFTS